MHCTSIACRRGGTRGASERFKKFVPEELCKYVVFGVNVIVVAVSASELYVRSLRRA